MALFKPQRKTSSGIEDLDIDAATLDGKDSSHYLNYNNLTNKPTIPSTSGLLSKTTYEWNKEIAFGSTGKLCIGKFPMYDSNLTVEIKATTSKTYSAILIIATQNVKNTQLGTLTATVYGDPNNDVGKNIYIEHVSGSNMIGVYFSPESWSKNLIHIQAVALNTNANYGNTAATDVCTNVDSIPTTATKQPTNALKQEYDVAKNIASALNTAGVVNADGTLKAKYDSDGNKITDTYLPKTGGEISGILKQTSGNLHAYGDLSYHNEYITFTSNASSSNVALSFKTGSRNGNNSEEVAFVTDLPSVVTTTKNGLMSSTDKTNLDTLSNLLGTDSDAVVNKINEVIEIFDSYPEGDKIADALAGKQSKTIDTTSLGPLSGNTTVEGTIKVIDDYIIGFMNDGDGYPVAKAYTADSATKATKDASGNVITTTYATKAEMSTAKNIAAALNSANVVNADGTLDAKYDGNGNEITTTYAKKEYAVYYVEGNTTGTAGTWTGTNNDITSLYDGLVVNYKVGIAGDSTTTLNINDLGAKTVYLRGTTKVTTHYAVGTMVLLAYNATTGAFYSADYDANSYAYVRQYKTTTNANYPMLFAYETTLPSSYDTKYTRKNSNITANPNTGTINATSFVENGTALSDKYLPLSGGTITGNLSVNDELTVANGIYAPLGCWLDDGIWIGDNDETYIGTGIQTRSLYLKNTDGVTTVTLDPATATYTIDGSQIVTKATESVIDLGTISSTPFAATCADLDSVTTAGVMYTFKYGGIQYFMTVYNPASIVYSQIIYYSPGGFYTRQTSDGGTSWSYSGYTNLTNGLNYASSGNTSSKLFLIGRTSQSYTGGTTYSHDTVYVDTDGHLYDGGKQVKTATDLSTTASNTTISGNFMIVSAGSYSNSMHAVDIDGVRYQTFSYDSTGNASWTFRGTKISNDLYVLETLCYDGTSLGHARVQTASVSAIEGKTYSRTLVGGGGGGQSFLLNDL